MKPYVYPYQYNTLLGTSPVLTEETWDTTSNWNMNLPSGSQMNLSNNVLNLTWEGSLLWTGSIHNTVLAIWNTSFEGSYFIESSISGNENVGLLCSIVTSFAYDPSFRFYYKNSKLIVDIDNHGITHRASLVKSVSRIRIRKSFKSIFFEYYDDGWIILHQEVLGQSYPYTLGMFGMGEDGNINFYNTIVGKWQQDVTSYLTDWYYDSQADELLSIENSTSPLYWTSSFDRTTSSSIIITNHTGGLYSLWNGSGEGYLLKTNSVTLTGEFYKITGYTETLLTSFDLPTDLAEYEIGIGYDNNYIVGWIRHTELEQLFIISDTTYSSGHIGLQALTDATYKTPSSVLVYDVKAVPNLVFRHKSCYKESNQDFIVNATYDRYEQMALLLDGIEATNTPELYSDDNLPYAGFANGDYFIPGDWDMAGLTALKEVFGTWEDLAPWILIWKHTKSTQTYVNSCKPYVTITKDNNYITMGGSRPEGVTEILFWWVSAEPSLSIQKILEDWNLEDEEVNLILNKSSGDNVTVYDLAEPEDMIEWADDYGKDLPENITPDVTTEETIDYIGGLELNETGDIYNWALPPLDDYEEDIDQGVEDLITDSYSNINRAWRMVSITLTAKWKNMLILLDKINVLESLDEAGADLINDYADQLDSILDNLTDVTDLYKKITCISINSLSKLTDALNDLEIPDIDFPEIPSIPDELLTNINNVINAGNLTNNVINDSLQAMKYESEHIKDKVNDLLLNDGCETNANKLVANATKKIEDAITKELEADYNFLQGLDL